MTEDTNNDRVQRRTVLRKGAVAAGGVALGTGVLSGSAAAQTVITEPTIIDEPGHYTLGNDISGVLSPHTSSIVIDASNVTLDGNGYMISGFDGAIDGFSESNITIYNLTASAGDFAVGVGNQSTVRNVDARARHGSAISTGESCRIIDCSIRSERTIVKCGSNSVVQNNTIRRSGEIGAFRGIRLGNTNDVTVANNTIGTPDNTHSWRPAIELRNADDNRIVKNSVGGDAHTSIKIDSDSNNNHVIRNDLSGPIEDDGSNTRLVANNIE